MLREEEKAHKLGHPERIKVPSKANGKSRGMIRTNNINFNSLKDEYGSDYDFEYSEGETSEDLSLNLNSRHTFFRTIEQHLNSIDPNVPNNSTISNLCDYDEEDFAIDRKNRPFIPRKEVRVLPIDHAIIMVFSYSQLTFPKSEYNHTFPPNIHWINPKNTPLNDLVSNVQYSYHLLYQKLRTQLSFQHIAAPSADKLNQLKNIRRDKSISRVLFHYVGYGYPITEDGNIYSYNPLSNSFLGYPIQSLFKTIGTPLFFIFDCDKAGSLLQPLISCANELLGTEKPKNTKGIVMKTDWEDWFAFFSTGVNEFLPEDSHLPRDFLTSCLLTPIQISIVCHILRYYSTSFKEPDFPLAYLEKACNNEEVDRLSILLDSIIDAIASDYLKPKLFSQLFRKDRLISILLRRFILAKYLLNFYNVHPMSYPQIPDMHHHSLWIQWEHTLDLWVTTNLIPPPTYIDDFYLNIIQTFSTSFQLQCPIRQSLLTLMCFAPFSGGKTCNQALNSLSQFSSATAENRVSISHVVVFHSFVAKLLTKDITPEEYHNLAYLVLTLIEMDLNIVFEIRKELNFESLIDYLFDDTQNSITRSFIAAILSSIMISMKTVKILCQRKEFLIKLKNEIPKASSQLLLWLLLLLKRTYDIIPIDIIHYYNESLHIQIASCVFHNSYECRAAAINALTSFIQNEDNQVNYYILLLTIPCIYDISYIVRYQLLLLIIKFISTHLDNINSVKIEENTNEIKSFSEFLQKCYLNKFQINFVTYLKIVDETINNENFKDMFPKIIYYLLDYFSHDPHPSIKIAAIKPQSMFRKLMEDSKTFINNMFHSSLTPPTFLSYSSNSPSFNNDAVFLDEENSSTDESYNNNNTFNNYFDNDFDTLYNISLRQLVRSKQINIKNNNNNNNKTNTNKIINNNKKVLIPQIQLRAITNINNINNNQQQNITNIIICNETSSIIISTKNKWIHSYDESLKPISKIRPSDYDVSDLQIIKLNGRNLVLICTMDGCIHLWDYKTKECNTTFRSDSNILRNDIPQYAAYNNKDSKLITGRGNSTINLWDLKKQKLIYEFENINNNNFNNFITSIQISNSNNLCFIGYNNGQINVIDLNNYLSNNSIYKLININSNKILNIKNYLNNKIIIVSTNGYILKNWNNLKKQFENEFKINFLIEMFDIHKELPIMAIGNKDSAPKIFDLNGKMLLDLGTMQSGLEGSLFAFNKKHPIINVVSPKGEIYSYNVMI